MGPGLNAGGGTALRFGTLADVAPTILDLMGVPVPEAMTGYTLIADPEPTHPERLNSVPA
jgi:bisphosphoglycerate-independent phosphoglycerate mutase (AlkP superfamily)